MESKTENRKWKNAGRFPAELLFMTGFFAGNVLPNLIWKMEWKQKTLASFYLIRSFAGKDISGGAYFLEVLRRRGGFFSSVVFMRIYNIRSAFDGRIYAVFGNGDRNDSGIIGSGIWYLWRCGRRGRLMPQYLVYIPAYFYLAGIVYRQSYGIWKNYGLVPQKTGAYFRQGITVFLLYTGGILAESFLNPWIVEKVIKGLKFF